jgi:hypothetical protein
MGELSGYNHGAVLLPFGRLSIGRSDGPIACSPEMPKVRTLFLASDEQTGQWYAY